ncbi:MAG TPA: hypothetical protein VGK29_23580 [Paludibaculum sp.]|jgi:hypothetical protein
MSRNHKGEWQDRRHFYFWHDQNPFAVKHLIEKMTGALLHRDDGDVERLTYAGSSDTGNRKCGIRLRFEAVIVSRNLYSLQLDSTATRQWVAEEAFVRDTNRAYEYWCAQLAIVEGVEWASAAPELYVQRKQECLDLEAAAAAKVEDPAPIAAIQKAVLDSLRAGKAFRRAHKEGGSILSYRGSSFIQTNYGEEPGRVTYATGDEMLVCLRNFFDWESRRDTYPHRPPELEVWQYIQRQLMD